MRLCVGLEGCGGWGASLAAGPCEGGGAHTLRATVLVNPVCVSETKYSKCSCHMATCSPLLAVMRRRRRDQFNFGSSPPTPPRPISELRSFLLVPKEWAGWKKKCKKKKKQPSPSLKRVWVFWGFLDCKPTFEKSYHSSRCRVEQRCTVTGRATASYTVRSLNIK